MTTPAIKKTPAHDALLHAAWEILLEHQGDLSAVKMADVVHRAKLTSGAFYNVWPGGMQDFQTSLLEHALDFSRANYVDGLLASLSQLDPSTLTLGELVRGFGAVDVENLRDDATFRVQVALWARHAEDERVAQFLGNTYRHFGERYAAVYTELLHMYGRRWRPPFTAHLFATLLTGLAEGLAMRQAVDPTAVPTDLSPDDHEGEPWTLFSLGAALILAAAVEPERGRPTAAWDTVRALTPAARRKQPS